MKTCEDCIHYKPAGYFRGGKWFRYEDSEGVRGKCKAFLPYWAVETLAKLGAHDMQINAYRRVSVYDAERESRA